MKALERIKEIEEYFLRQYSAPMVSGKLQTQTVAFLLKALKTWRSIAISFADNGDGCITHDEVIEILDKEFEERMAEGEESEQG